MKGWNGTQERQGKAYGLILTLYRRGNGGKTSAEKKHLIHPFPRTEDRGLIMETLVMRLWQDVTYW